MASDLFEVLDSYRTVETLGGLETVDVQRVVVRALPSGVAFGIHFTMDEAKLNDPDLLARATASLARPYALGVDTVVNMPGVAGVYSYSDFTPSQQIEDRWVVTITSTSGNLSTTRDLPFYTFRHPENFEPILAETRAALDQLEAAGR